MSHYRSRQRAGGYITRLHEIRSGASQNSPNAINGGQKNAKNKNNN